MFKRVIWIILDSVGIGELPDADLFGDVGADTLGHIFETIKDYNEKYRLPYIIENGRGLKRRVVVQPEWRDFLMTNYRVIMEWVHDEKIKYLEKRKIEESAS